LNIISKISDNIYIEKFITNLFVQYQQVHLLIHFLLLRIQRCGEPLDCL